MTTIKKVITPGGPRPPKMVHRVGPGQVIYPDQHGGYAVMPEQMVLTPGGFRSRSLVHSVETGHGLRHDAGVLKKINLATKQLFDFPPPLAGALAPGWPLLRRRFEAVPAGPGAAPRTLPAKMGDGWIVYAWWDSGALPIGRFLTTWTVPQAPKTKSGQTVFLFNGIQNTGFDVDGIDAALYSGSKCYFFSGNQYIRVTRGETGPGTVDPGYPKPISTWGWGSFGANGIDAALYSGSKCYFFSGNQYIRVTRGETGSGTVDPGYPAPTSNWFWPGF